MNFKNKLKRKAEERITVEQTPPLWLKRREVRAGLGCRGRGAGRKDGDPAGCWVGSPGSPVPQASPGAPLQLTDPQHQDVIMMLRAQELAFLSGCQRQDCAIHSNEDE